MSNWRICAAVMLLGVTVCAVCFFADGQTPEFAVYILDVGQGDAILVRTQTAVMLVDAGPNAAEEQLRYALRRIGVGRLDVLILTHPDEDHIGGADMVLRQFGAERVYLPPCTAKSGSFLRLLDVIAETGHECSIGEMGVSFPLGGAEVELLWPGARLDAEPNNASIVTRVCYGETAVLLMGDAEASVEDALLAACPPERLRADLLKLGHHGAASATTDAFLEAVSPVWAAVSCGAANSFGHPSSEVRARLRTHGVLLARTDKQGMLVFVSDGKTLTWRKAG